MKWYLTVIRAYADCDGRAQRAEFWMFQLVVAVLFGVSFLIARSAPIIGLVLIAATAFFHFIPSWAVIVRRLHDTSRSALWLLWLMIPFGGIVLLFPLCFRSDPHRNKYGPSAGSQTSAGSPGVVLSP
jgi:uncharacterized membrane protein YhaH (DUF805 family)